MVRDQGPPYSEFRPLEAIALRYDPEVDSVPRLIARGRGHIARRILQIAQKNSLPVRQDPDLVEALSALPIGLEIPAELYRAAAEVLAFAYRAGRMSPRGGIGPGG